MASTRSLILSVNAGSSSLKISLYCRSKESNSPITLLLTSSISSISSPPAKFSFKLASSSPDTPPPIKDDQVHDVTSHASAFAHFLYCLQELAHIERANIAQVCHRVVHGGDYSDPVVISDESYNHIKNLSDLAPLHNGAALSVIKACISALPDAHSIAYFDTAFHRSIPPHIASYAINQRVAQQKGLKKYGFHGLSYAFILRSVAQFFNKPPTALNLIILHLGSGASVCAVRGGHSLDTSMGLTPLSGLPGATRSGAIDPSLIFHYTNKAGRMSHDPDLANDLRVTEAEDILNTKSGWKSLTGTTDFGVITTRANSGKGDEETKASRLAFDLFVDRILDYVGSYHLKLDGHVDALVFSGGIGEHSTELRKVLGEKLGCLEFAEVDAEKNEGVEGEQGVVVDVGVEKKDKGDKRILVCRTDEQGEMARQCAVAKELE